MQTDKMSKIYYQQVISIDGQKYSVTKRSVKTDDPRTTIWRLQTVEQAILDNDVTTHFIEKTEADLQEIVFAKRTANR